MSIKIQNGRFLAGLKSKNGHTILGKKSIKKLSTEWLRLLREKKELEICLSKQETQKDKDRISSDVFDSLCIHYQDRLESLSSLHQEIEGELLFVRRRVSEEIDFLEKELKPIQKKYEEFQFPYK